MRPHLPLAGALLFAAAGAALADHDDVLGTYTLRGHTSQGARVEARLCIEEDGFGRLRVTRTGSEGWRGPSRTWVAQEVRRLGSRRYRVEYTVASQRGIAHLGRGRTDVDLLVADYRFSFGGRRVEETVRNRTRRVHGWSRLRASGDRLGSSWSGTSTRVIRRSTTTWGHVRTHRRTYPGTSTRTVIVRRSSPFGHTTTARTHGGHRGTRFGRHRTRHGHRVRHGLPTTPHSRLHRRHRARTGAGITYSTRSGGASFSFSIGGSR